MWAEACSPPGARSKGRAQAGVASGFSWLFSDLGQDVGWHQTPLLAAADADEAISILAPAHAHTDLSGRDMKLRLGTACVPGPKSCWWLPGGPSQGMKGPASDVVGARVMGADPRRVRGARPGSQQTQSITSGLTFEISWSNAPDKLPFHRGGNRGKRTCPWLTRTQRQSQHSNPSL